MLIKKDNLEKAIKEMVSRLFQMARESCCNTLSDNCCFILSEIKDNGENFHRQRLLRKTENDRKKPVPFGKLMPEIKKLYGNLYDINLYIYKAEKSLTVIDIAYYPKSSLNDEHRKKVVENPAMLHAKIAVPPWVNDKAQKFDINWEHQTLRNRWKLFWFRRKLKWQIAQG